VGLDVGPVGNAGGIANLLGARDVVLDTIHIDDKGRRSVFTGDLQGERAGQGSSLSGGCEALWQKLSRHCRYQD
jgi:hypothetical protein